MQSRGQSGSSTHAVKAAFMADPDNSAVLLSDISNAYNERARAKMLSTLSERSR